MDRIQFGTFIWPINPETFQLEYLKEPRYVTSKGNTVYAGLSPLKRTVTGSGYFTGANAYATINELAKLSPAEIAKHVVDAGKRGSAVDRANEKIFREWKGIGKPVQEGTQVKQREPESAEKSAAPMRV